MAAIGTRALVVSIGATDYTAEVSNCRITAGDSDSDFLTFADAAAGGGRQYALEFTAVQDAETGSLWDQVFTVAGTTVACIVKPYGNTVASATQPHFTFNAVVKEPDGDFLGGEANSSTTSRFTFDASWPLEGKPTRLVTP